MAKALKFSEQVFQRFAFAVIELGKPVKRFKGFVFTVFYDQLRTGNPVCFLSMDQVAYYVKCAPGTLTFIFVCPVGGQVL